VHQSPENTGDKVRRVLAHELRVSESLLTNDFRWIDEVTPEDAGWVLTAVQDAFGSTQLFDDFVEPETLSRISSVHGLIEEIQGRFDRVTP
jgi:hypothetical protein